MGVLSFLEDRAEMMQTWADYLDALRNDEDVSRFKNRLANSTSITSPEQVVKKLLEQLGKDKILDLLK